MRGTICIGALWVLACGGADLPDGPAYSRADEVLAVSVRAPRGATSECSSSGECQRECERGVAGACTRWGDHVFPGAPLRAEDLWADGCKAGDAGGCARLMHATAASAELSDRYGWRACVGGSMLACELLGNAMFVRAMAPGPDEDAAELFRESAKPYRLACQQNRWLGCVRAAASLQRTGDAGAKSEAENLARRGFDLANAKCEESSVEACDFLAQWAEKAGDAAKAKVSYARGCRALLERCSPAERPRLADEPICRRAEKLGVAPPDLRSIDPPATLREPPIVAAMTLEPRRVAGKADIQPPVEVARYMAEKNIGTAASATLCLSKQGMVSGLNIDLASGSTAYDRILFEGMRTWRYRPFLLNGEPTPVCTRVTFIYRPR
jgi:hypothetical protein